MEKNIQEGHFTPNTGIHSSKLLRWDLCHGQKKKKQLVCGVISVMLSSACVTSINLGILITYQWEIFYLFFPGILSSTAWF